MIFGLRKWPIVATVVVLVAAGVMVMLGFWQLQRLAEKEALLADYAAAQASEARVDWPSTLDDVGPRLYRSSTLTCRRVLDQISSSGRNDEGTAGFAQIATCEIVDPTASVPDESMRTAKIVLGWSNRPAIVQWSGGVVIGTIAPGPRLVADPPLAGLQANATPNPNDLPNNHLAYAFQWFFFALTALVIYVLALRRREG